MTGRGLSAAVFVGVLFAGPAGAAEVWSRTAQADGAAVYACTSGECGRDATISCRVMPAETVTTIEQFTARLEKQVATLRAAGREIEARPATRSPMGARALFRSAFYYASGAPAFETGFLVGDTEAFAVVSTAADAKTMKRNFDRFVARLAARPSGAGGGDCPP